MRSWCPSIFRTTRWLLFGAQVESGPAYYLGLTGMAGCFIYQHRMTRSRRRDDYFAAFTNNIWAGFCFFCGVILDAIVSAVIG